MFFLICNDMEATKPRLERFQLVVTFVQAAVAGSHGAVAGTLSTRQLVQAAGPGGRSRLNSACHPRNDNIEVASGKCFFVGRGVIRPRLYGRGVRAIPREGTEGFSTDRHSTPYAFFELCSPYDWRHFSGLWPSQGFRLTVDVRMTVGSRRKR